MKKEQPAKLKILLVDDDEVIGKTLQQVLEKEGYDVVVAENGEAAKSIALLQNFNAVLSDIHMPGKISGIELFHFIKETQKIPFILMTGFATIAETKSASDLGVSGFLAKPFKSSELLKKIKELCGVTQRTAEEEVSEDDNYSKIGIDDFVSGRSIQFNIFVRVSASKYIKVAHQGENIAIDRIRVYKEKGIKYLYLLKDDFQKYMQFNLNLTKLVKNSSAVSKEKKLHLLTY